MTLASSRVPRRLRTLKTHPGGHRAGRFDPRIHALWSLLVNPLGDKNGRSASDYERAGLTVTDRARFELTVNLTLMARTLHVDRKTVRRWLAFFERRGWLELARRRGGRGCGVSVRLSWLERGEELARRRERAVAHKREQMRPKCETGAQGQTQTPLRGDSQNRARLMARARATLTHRIHDPRAACAATRCFGRWLWREHPSLERAQQVLNALQVPRRIPVPRWARSAQAIHRWFRGLIARLVRYGAGWWDRLAQPVTRRRLERTLGRIRAAVEAGRPCPVCQRRHSRWEFSEGIGCAGWARLQLAELRRPQAARAAGRGGLVCRACGGRTDLLIEGRCRRCAGWSGDAEVRCAEITERFHRRFETPRRRDAHQTTGLGAPVAV